MTRLDIHVLTSAGRDVYRAECLASLEGIPGVEVHVVAGNPGHIGQARRIGYGIGTAPYITRVDDDDRISDPEAMLAALDALDADPAAALACTDLWIIDRNGERTGHRKSRPNARDIARSPGAVQHLAIYRREAVTDVLPGLDDWPVLDDWYMAAQAIQRGHGIRIPVNAYEWRIWRKGPTATPVDGRAAAAMQGARRAVMQIVRGGK